MKLLFFVLVSVFIFDSCFGSVGFSLPEKKTVCDKNGKCVDYCNYKEKNLLPGESYNNKCNLITCNENFSMNFQGCGVASSDDCKRFGPDLSLKYPKCCNRICVEI